MSFISVATISVHKFVSDVGAYVGFASLIAVALLILLYFAHARDSATQRNRLEEAQARIGGLEARLAQLLQAQRARTGAAPAPVAPPAVAPVPVRQMSPAASAVSAQRRVPSPATAAAAVAAAPDVAAATALVERPPAPGSVPVAPIGMAAPALASATKLIPDPIGLADAAGPEDTMFVPAPVAAIAAANGNGNGNGKHEAAPPTDATQAIPAATQAGAAQAAATQAGATQAIPPVAAAAARTPSASPRGSAAQPPRAKIGAGAAAAGVGAATGAGAAAGISAPRRTVPTISPGRGGGRRRFAGRVLPLLIAGVAVAVIIVALVVITNTGGTPASNARNSSGNGATGQSLAGQHHGPPPFKPADYRVAVLNGTAVSGLAAHVSTKLAHEGFKKGNATNAASQTEAATYVYYMTGAGAATAHNRTAAHHVAKALKVPESRVRQATAGPISSCAISATGTPLHSCNAEVIVSVGADRQNLATG